MALTKLQLHVIISRLNEVSGGRTLVCPVSNDTNWTVNLYYGAVPATDALGTSAQLMSQSYPNAVVICDTCGYTMMFNLYRLGLAEALGASPPEVDEEENG